MALAELTQKGLDDMMVMVMTMAVTTMMNTMTVTTTMGMTTTEEIYAVQYMREGLTMSM